MVAWTPKYNLPVEEPGDPADMTAALDQASTTAASWKPVKIAPFG